MSNEQQNNDQQNDDALNNSGEGGDNQSLDWLDSQIGNLEKTDDKSGEATGDKNKENTQQNTQQNNTTRQPTNRDSESDNAQQVGQGNGQDRRVQQTRPQARQYGTHFRTNDRNDIVDVNGVVVARSGGERAIFHKLFPLIDVATREAAGLKQRLEHYENANALAKKEGITLDEQGAAFSFMVQWKKSPAEAIKSLLQIAQQRGIDTTEIAQGGGGFNQAAVMTAITDMIEEKLQRFAPFLAQLQDQQQNNEIIERTQQDYDAFMQSHPDAEIHIESLASVMRDKDVDAEKAYLILYAFAAKEGLDWNKDLKPQLLARQSNNNGQNNRPNGGGNNRPLPNMNGRGANNEAPAGRAKMANPDDSWDSIAREVLTEHGRQV